MFGAIISAGAALIGGNRARKHEKDERSKDRYMNSPEGIRKNAEKAGFNPLVFAGPGTGTGVGYAPTMGSSIANSWALAGEAIGGGISQKLAEKSQLTELQQENERLEKLAERSILNPKVQGIYGNARARSAGQRFHRDRSADRSDDRSVRDDGDLFGHTGGLGSSSVVAPGRSVEVSPYTTGPGLTEINNRGIFGEPIVVPGSDGEPWGIDEVATAFIFGAPQLAGRGLKAVKNYYDKHRHDRAWDDWYDRQTNKKPVSRKSKVPYSSKNNKPPRGYYGRPGSRSGF
jgi:hypothetical protein